MKSSLLVACSLLILLGGIAIADENASSKVLLGDPRLSAGIPGSGKLTVEQIRKWLADPKNHETLEVQLPEGLAAGAASISIPEDNPLTRAKVELGRQLYFDSRLSSDGTISCASCHHPDQGWGAHTRFGVGVRGQEGGRNSPISYNRILSTLQFWDGRAGKLEEQAVGPIANPIEMANTHVNAVKTLNGIEGYRLQFEKIFPKGGLNIDNVGRALASFERIIVTGTSPADIYEPYRAFVNAYKSDLENPDEFKKEDPDSYADYLKLKKALDESAMSESAQRGREIFFSSDRGNCTACHVGANFTDEKYHNLGVGMEQQKPDLGRYEITRDEKDKGAFKTPTIRNVALSAPYMHDGSQKTLEEVVEWYARGGHPNPYLSDKIKKLNLTEQDKKDLVEYMKSLTGPFPKVVVDRLP